jgi:hypothetical protein
MRPGRSEIRHQIVIYPFIAIMASWGLSLILERENLSKIISWILISLLFLPLLEIVPYNLKISRKDTRTLAKEWIETNIPSGSKILIDENGPVLHFSENQIKQMIIKAQGSDRKGQFTAHYDTYSKYRLIAARDLLTYDLYEIRKPWWREKEGESGSHLLETEYDKDMGNPLKPLGVEEYEHYLGNSFDFAVVNSYQYKRFFKNTTTSKEFPSFTKFYRQLFSRGTIIKEFSPRDGNRPGPEVKVFKFK